MPTATTWASRKSYEVPQRSNDYTGDINRKNINKSSSGKKKGTTTKRERDLLGSNKGNTKKASKKKDTYGYLNM